MTILIVAFALSVSAVCFVENTSRQPATCSECINSVDPIDPSFYCVLCVTLPAIPIPPLNPATIRPRCAVTCAAGEVNSGSCMDQFNGDYRTLPIPTVAVPLTSPRPTTTLPTVPPTPVVIAPPPTTPRPSPSLPTTTARPALPTSTPPRSANVATTTATPLPAAATGRTPPSTPNVIIVVDATTTPESLAAEPEPPSPTAVDAMPINIDSNVWIGVGVGVGVCLLLVVIVVVVLRKKRSAAPLDYVDPYATATFTPQAHQPYAQQQQQQGYIRVANKAHGSTGTLSNTTYSTEWQATGATSPVGYASAGFTQATPVARSSTFAFGQATLPSEYLSTGVAYQQSAPEFLAGPGGYDRPAPKKLF
jgi:hypothetical protein